MSRRPFTLLLTANAISITGTSMTLLAVPWFVLQTTGSPARTGVAAACETVPLVLASAFGGPLVDRLGARTTAIVSDLLSAVGVTLVPLLALTVGLRFWQLCLFVGLTGLVRAPGDTARAVLVPGLVELAGTPMGRATSAFDGVSRGARMVGAPLAGVLIAALGPAQVLLVDAGTFLVSAALLRTALPVAVRTAPEHAGRYLTQLREGIGGLRRDRLILAIVSMVLLTNLLDAAWATVFMPVYARTVLHSSVALGLLFGCFGAGALSGTVLYGIVGPRLRRWPVFTAAFLLVGAPRLFLLALEPPLVVLLVLSVATGLAAGAINPILSAVEYERIPPHLRSRVFGAMAAGALGGMPLGALLGGVVVERAGLQVAVVGAGLLYLLATLSPLVFRVWRQMDDARAALPARGRRQPQRKAAPLIT